jgi:hypothetical protein
MDDSTNNLLSTGEHSPVGKADSEAQARIDLARSVVGPPRRSHHRYLRALIGLIALLVVGVILAWTLGGKPKVKPKSTASAASHSTLAKSSSQAASIPTQTYTSSDFGLSLHYPDGWDVVDSGSGPMTVTSRPMTLVSATGQSLTGEVIVTIQKQGQLPTAFNGGTDLAVLNSQLISYTNPSTTQNSQTYISFVQYSATNTKGGLDGIYVTGNDGYSKDQVIPASDINQINPLITITFTKCGNSSCSTNLTPLTIASTSWASSVLQKSVLTLLTSLVFQ